MSLPPQNHPRAAPAEEDEEEEEQPEWDKDTDEIASLSSDELHETRPNRWAGSASTWHTFTDRERRAWAAIDGARRRNLALHLYNAFALRRVLRARRREQNRTRGKAGGGDGEDADRDDEDDKDEDDFQDEDESGNGNPSARTRDWSPPRHWAAWPVRAAELPPDGLMVSDTEHRPEPGAGALAGGLDEEIAALMLRYAREKFLSRGRRAQPGEDEVVGEEVLQTIEPGADKSSEEEIPPATKEAVAVPTADDETAYALMMPVSRRILAKLDAALTVLHHARAAAVGDAEGGEEGERGEMETEGISRGKRGRPRKAPRPRGKRWEDRTRSLPREGETHRDMLVRVAQETKRRMPELYAGGAHTEEEVRRRSKVGRKPRSGSKSRSRSRSRVRSIGENISRWGLRDWRDVLGAAALAGFPAEVVARATQRCATLFGQEMSLHVLPEQAAEEEHPVETTRYVPGAAVSESSSDEEGDVRDELEQLRAVSRHSSVRPGSPSPERPTRRRSPVKRSRSVVSGGEQQHFCPHATCPRALVGFSRRGNLARHLQTMHDGDFPGLAGEREVDSMDEMDGAVHVDGFLRPIKTRTGWRGGDAAPGRARPSKVKNRPPSPSDLKQESDSSGYS